MASRYKLFLRLCSEWPVDISKTDRDLGTYIRKVVGERFKLGEASQIDEKECKRQYEALQKINTDYYKTKYEIPLRKGCTGLSADELHDHLSTQSMEAMSREEGIFTRMKKSLEVENNENKITILAKELRSLRRNVESKISNLQEEIGTQNKYKQHYRYYEMKKLFKKVHDLKYLTLTLKLDVRQLFYEDDFKSTYLSPLTTKAPLQTLDVSLELDKKLTVSCYRTNTKADEFKTELNPFSHWYHNGNRIASKDRHYAAEYSRDKSVVTLTISKLKYKDTGVLECKDNMSEVFLHINLKVKEPCKDFKCDGKCVEWSRICDKNKDCLRGQDEIFCELIADVTDGAMSGRGTVVVLLNRMKGWVCYDGWDQSGADVLCRSLGYSRGMVGNPRIHFEDRGFLVADIECTGNEQSLAQCNRNITRVGSCQAIATALCMNK
ncbi:uncharacterized protein LOC134705674 [Mytilus trossulus]|uniref:uncharacterized protein LOC134705674 n=1 Tax=Mytilus trossulus TaxID=6551 RepID=UPI0030073E8C